MALMLSVIYGYMKINDQQEERPTPIEVFQKMLPRIPMLVVLIILISIVSFIGFIIFLLPGIYLMITLSLAVPVYIFEDKSIGTSFTKSFKLVNDKWWSTFGLIMVTVLIASVLSYIFLIPMYVLMVGSIVSAMSQNGNDPDAIFSIFTSWYTVVGMTIVMIGSYLTYLVPIIAVGFQYFNLSERIEGRGIRNQIKEFETV